MNFTDALDKTAGEIVKPPLIPVGTYRWRVEKLPAFSTSEDERFDFVDFQLQCLGPTDDVDTEALQEYEGKSGKINDVRRRKRFLFNKQDEGAFKREEWNLKRFLLEHLQVEATDDTPLKQVLNSAVNAQCLGSVGWRVDKNNPEVQYDEIKSTAPID